MGRESGATWLISRARGGDAAPAMRAAREPDLLTGWPPIRGFDARTTLSAALADKKAFAGAADQVDDVVAMVDARCYPDAAKYTPGEVS